MSARRRRSAATGRAARGATASRRRSKTGGRAAARKSQRAPSTRRRGGGRLIWRLVGAALVLGVVSVLALFLWTTRSPRARSDGPVRVTITSTEPAAVAATLEAAGLTDSPRLMAWALRWLSLGQDVVPRVHLLTPGSSPRTLMRHLVESRSRGLERVTLVEGWNRWQIADQLEKQGISTRRDFLDAVEDPDLMGELGVPGDSAEGYLFPATYPLPRDDDPRRLVRRFVREARERFRALQAKVTLDHELAQLGFGERELVTLASMVEKETGRESERGRIARVFINRLRHPEVTSGRLQSDPTARYGCRLQPALPSCAGAATGVTAAMLRDAGNPYNTYRHAGLPPGPVANPGEAALLAVLSPPPGDDFFFVADGEGGHSFSRHFDDHRRAVRELRELRGPSGDAPSGAPSD